MATARAARSRTSPLPLCRPLPQGGRPLAVRRAGGEVRHGAQTPMPRWRSRCRADRGSELHHPFQPALRLRRARLTAPGRAAWPSVYFPVSREGGTQSRGPELGSRFAGARETVHSLGGGPLHLPSNGDIVLRIDDHPGSRARSDRPSPFAGRGIPRRPCDPRPRSQSEASSRAGERICGRTLVDIARQPAQGRIPRSHPSC